LFGGKGRKGKEGTISGVENRGQKEKRTQERKEGTKEKIASARLLGAGGAKAGNLQKYS